MVEGTDPSRRVLMQIHEYLKNHELVEVRCLAHHLEAMAAYAEAGDVVSMMACVANMAELEKDFHEHRGYSRYANVNRVKGRG